MKTKRVLKKIAALSTGAAMLGATLTGALALDTTLADYPAPFVTNGIFSGLLVVGANAAASDTIGQAVLLANLQTKAVTRVSGGGTISVAGGVSEDIPLGGNISDAGSNTLDIDLADDDISTLLDTTITFQSTDYDVSEELYINQKGNAVTVETSLTASEDDYQTDIVLELPRKAIKYYYNFDEEINLNDTTSSQPLEIKFLGKTLKITNIATDTKFTAYVGTEYFMNVGDSVQVEGKTVTLENVGSGGAIVISVDGVSETIPSSSTETVGGIEVANDETFYEDTKEQRSATLIMGKDAQETYTDGDAYVGEDEDNPDWVWNMGNLNTKASTTTKTTAEFTGPYIGIENDFIYNDDSDNPPTVGECIDLPNNYLSICLDSLTLSDDNYVTYTFEWDNSADLSDADDNLDSAGAIYIHTSQSEGLIIDGGDIFYNGTAHNKDLKVQKIWLFADNDGALPGGNVSNTGIYYEDTSTNKVRLAGSAGNETFAHINYDNTKDTDIPLVVSLMPNFINVTLQPYDSTDLDLTNDDIIMSWAIDSTGVTALGSTASSEEAMELSWNTGITIGTKDEDHRSRYGIIIRDPKAHGASDEVVLEIPGDQVQANIIVSGSAVTTSTTGGAVRINPIPTSVAVLDTEVTSPTAQNVIVVGGPAVNRLASSVFGLAVADFTPNEAMVKLADNGANVALLVAGYEAVDTRNAADAVATGKLAGKAKTDVVVKSTQLNEYTVE